MNHPPEQLLRRFFVQELSPSARKASSQDFFSGRVFVYSMFIFRAYAEYI